MATNGKPLTKAQYEWAQGIAKRSGARVVYVPSGGKAPAKSSAKPFTERQWTWLQGMAKRKGGRFVVTGGKSGGPSSGKAAARRTGAKRPRGTPENPLYVRSANSKAAKKAGGSKRRSNGIRSSRATASGRTKAVEQFNAAKAVETAAQDLGAAAKKFLGV